MTDLFNLIKNLSVQNPFFFAPIFGFVPALIWLWFWLKEDIHPEPNKFIIFTFLMGMISVLFALPLQKIIYNLVYNRSLNIFENITITATPVLFFIWATIEECLKFLGAFIGGLHSSADDEPIDPIIYMIVSALGFVALENTLFLIDPLSAGNFSDVFITGNLRFIGATLLHITASSIIGIFIALSFYRKKIFKILFTITGIILSIVLHTYFNLFIISQSQGNVFLIFGGVWIIIIFLMLIFEKIKNSYTKN